MKLNSTNEDIAVSSSDLAPERPPGFLSRHKRSFWGTLLTLAAVVAAILVYVIFFGNPDSGPVFEGEVKVEVRAPEESLSGDEVAYELVIDNQSNAALTDVRLEVFYPNDFLFVSSNPSFDREDRVWPLADLPSGEKQLLEVKGLLQGSVQEIKTLNVRLRYIPANFSSQFEVAASASTEILAPELVVSIDTPEQLIAGQNGQFTVSVANFSERTYPEILVRADYPENFIYRDSTPEPVRNRNNEWQISNLEVGDKVDILINGQLSGESGKEKIFQVELFTPNENGDLSSLVKNFAFIELESSPFTISQSLISGGGKNNTVLPGDKLRYRINYEHNGRTALHNMIVTVELEPGVFDLSKVSNTDGQVQGNKLVWIPASSPELLIVNPGASGEFDFTVPISSELVNLGRPNLVAKTSVSYIADELSEATLGNELALKVQSQPLVGASLEIIAGADPPRQGEESTYLVTLSVTNTVNTVDNAQLSLTIPSLDTEFSIDSVTPAQEKASVEFVPLSRVLRWSLGSLPAFTGTFREARILRFQVTTAERRGFLQDIVLTGLDSFTGDQVSSEGFDL